jgi:hypothetical protein
MHLGHERTAAFIRHALDAGSYVVCHETLTYGDFPEYGAGDLLRVLRRLPLNAAKAGSNRETAPPGNRQKRYQPSDRSWNPREPLNRNPKSCRLSRPWHTRDQGRHGIVGITGGSP